MEIPKGNWKGVVKENSHTPPKMSLEILGWGSTKTKRVTTSMKLNWNSSGEVGGGVLEKIPSGGGMDIFFLIFFRTHKQLQYITFTIHYR